MTAKGNSLKIDLKARTITGTFEAVFFQNDGYWVFYAPALDISSYGLTKEEAETSFFEVYLKEYFSNIINNPSDGMKELESMGWKRNKHLRKQFYSDSYVDKDGFLNEFNLPEDTEIVNKEFAV
ncbi:hypothetical protein [Mongoliitalea lutea]|uniref:Uncharacterized protein n=1 Tax=Mongoliitalea lutea TaxID=849756 RepID=A0A8J3CYG3_9BACT|nr:hypothetical protein [Mongoliitalea lutea]GHB44374.1 hypothetical protein GCM10008106_26790 [Mongoliitalea lutea]